MASSSLSASKQTVEVVEFEVSLYQARSYQHAIGNPSGWALKVTKLTAFNGFGEPKAFANPSSHSFSLVPSPSGEGTSLPLNLHAKLILTGFINSSTTWQPIVGRSTHLLVPTFESAPNRPGNVLQVTLLLRFDQQTTTEMSLQVVTRTITDHLARGGTPDVEFFVFSKRANGIGAFSPTRLFGKESLLLGKSHEFDALIRAREFATHDECPTFIDAATYGYDDDSDLEDTDDEHIFESRFRIARGAQPERSVDGDIDRYSLITAQEDLNVLRLATDTPTLSESTLQQSVSIYSERENAEVKCSRPHATFNRSIVVRDSALATWYSLIYYLYTGEVAFAPLKSSGAGRRKKFIRDYARKNPHHPLPCSPKSMFRLADKYGFHALEELALNDLVSGLTAKNIVSEYFSTFTLRYEKIQTAEFAYFRDHFQTPEVKKAWKTHMPEILSDPEMLAFSHSTSTKLLYLGNE